MVLFIVSFTLLIVLTCVIFRLKDGVKLKPSASVVLEKSQQTYVLILRQARLDDAGRYTVKAVNATGEITASAELNVHGWFTYNHMRLDF